ncbi:MAG: serine hydrolase domain-containing protein [Bacteroidota bacterium]
MHRLLVALVLVLTTTGVSACNGASQLEAYADEGPAAQTHEEAVERARTRLAQRMEDGVPGFSVAVAVDGEIVWAEGMGVADRSTGAPVTTDTRFRIGSTSKSVTGALAGRLLDRDLISLDADIREVLPSFPAKSYPITLRDLLSMQAGIRHYQGNESRNRRAYSSVAEGLQIFAEDPLLFEPHTDMRYSSYGFNLAGAVLAQALGTSYGEAIETEIFEPLGMTASGIDDPTQDIPERSRFYSPGIVRLNEAPEVNDSYKAPSGGLLSTPSDMVRFGSALLSRRAPDGETWMSEETVRTLFTPRPTTNQEQPAFYALGFRVWLDDPGAPPPYGRYTVHHGGSSVGARSMLMLFPDEGVVISLLANSDGYDTKEIDTEAIASGFIDAYRGGRSPSPTTVE